MSDQNAYCTGQQQKCSENVRCPTACMFMWMHVYVCVYHHVLNLGNTYGINLAQYSEALCCLYVYL